MTLGDLLRRRAGSIKHLSLGHSGGQGGRGFYQAACQAVSRTGYSIAYDDDPEKALIQAIGAADHSMSGGDVDLDTPAPVPAKRTRWKTPPEDDLLGDDDEDLLG